ncbi:MAG: O-antigen ligase family protein [Chloroflexi bacterium]|nr:O-antigen ligase family protein [Chloroflexota bacterium]
MVGVLNVVQQSHWPPRLGVVEIGFLGIVVTQTVAYVTSVDPARSLLGLEGSYQGLATQLALVSVYVLGYIVARQAGGHEGVVRLAVIGSVPVVLHAVLQAFNLDWIVWAGEAKPQAVFSTIGGPNELAGYLLLMIPCGITLALSSGMKAKIAVSTLVGFMAFALVLTGSRAGILSLAIMICAAASYSGFFRRSAAASSAVSLRPDGGSSWYAFGWVLAIFLSAAAALTIAFSPFAAAYSRPAINGSLLDASAMARIDIWKTGIVGASDRLLTGYGQDSVPAAMKAAGTILPAAGDQFADWYVTSSHNLLLDRLINTGLLGLAFYVFTLVALYVKVQRRIAAIDGPRRTRVICIGLALGGFLIHYSLNPPYALSESLFWLLAGTVCGIVEGDSKDTLKVKSTSPNALRPVAAEPGSGFPRGHTGSRAPRSLPVLVAGLTGSVALVWIGLFGSPWPKPIGVPGPLPQPAPYPISQVPRAFSVINDTPRLVSQTGYRASQLVIMAAGAGIAYGLARRPTPKTR